MAKKSNKTEHVLKLITKDEETIEGLSEKEPTKEAKIQEEVPKAMPLEVEVSVKPKEEEKELKYEAKLKIEIDPEINLKSRETEMEKVAISQPMLHEQSALIEDHDHLVNVAEILAKEKLSLVMQRMNVCNCPTCTNDILALALNTLPTKYVTTDAGKQYLQLDIYKKQYETDILAALTKACVRVKACPRH